VPPVNRRTCVPPGRLPTGGDGDARHLLVSSLPRSGTHLLIDLVLNNFRRYRRSPLYVNLDRWLAQGGSASELRRAPPLVLKAHLPAFDPAPSETVLSELRDIAGQVSVVRPVRDLEEVFPSYRSMRPELSADQFAEEAAGFERFWEEIDAEVLRVPFARLVERPDDVVGELARHLDLRVPKRVRPPRPKAHRFRIGTDKLLTRLVGARAPVINTSIRMAPPAATVDVTG
jgi:hypothetical protein